MAKKKKDVEVEAPEPVMEVKEEEPILTLSEVFEQSKLSLTVFIGVLVNGGLQKKYDDEVENLKANKPAIEFMKLSEFNKLKKEYLNKQI